MKSPKKKSPLRAPPPKPLKRRTSKIAGEAERVRQTRAFLNDWFDKATSPYSGGASKKSLYRMMVEGSSFDANPSLQSVYQQMAAALNDLFVDLHLGPADVRRHVEIEHAHGGLLLDSLFYWTSEDEPLWKTREGIGAVMAVLKKNAPFVLLQDDARRDGFLIRLYKFFVLKKTRKTVSFFDDCSYYKHFGFKTTADFQIDHIRDGMVKVEFLT